MTLGISIAAAPLRAHDHFGRFGHRFFVQETPVFVVHRRRPFFVRPFIFVRRRPVFFDHRRVFFIGRRPVFFVRRRPILLVSEGPVFGGHPRQNGFVR
jgi:hypothetical protein